MSFDLKKNNLAKMADEGYEFELRLPELNEPVGAFLTVRGSNSDKVKAFGKRRFNEQQAKELQAKRKGREPDPMTIEEAEDVATESAVVRLISWRGLEEDGVEVPFSVEKAREVLKAHPWIREAIIQESDTLGNFMRK